MQYGLIGGRLGHSYSVPIHRLITGEDYELREIAPEDLGAFMTRKEFRAINVTIPYKQDVIPYLDEISDTAREIGAVNTIVNRDGHLYGTNTDAAGLQALINGIGALPGGILVGVHLQRGALQSLVVEELFQPVQLCRAEERRRPGCERVAHIPLIDFFLL